MQSRVETDNVSVYLPSRECCARTFPDSRNMDICTPQLSLQVETQPSSCPWMCTSGLEHTSQTAYVSKGLREGLLDLIVGVGAYAVSVHVNLAEDV